MHHARVRPHLSAPVWIGLTLLALLVGAHGSAPPLSLSPAPPVVNVRSASPSALTSLPLLFIENRGQVASEVAYTIQGRDKTLHFTDAGMTLVLNTAAAGGEPYTVKLDFVGARAVRPVGLDQTDARVSVLKGQPSQWQAGLATFTSIVYHELWPGIDLVYSGTVQSLKYKFVVQPGADPTQIRLAYRGVDSLSVLPDGHLAVHTPVLTFNDQSPMAFQAVDGQPREIPVAYALAADPSMRSYQFKVGAYDPRYPLIIDPAILVYAGYLGGSGEDRGNAIAVDSVGAVYVTGTTYSSQTSFPTGTGFGGIPGVNRTFIGNRDAFVIKLNPGGTSLIYATYLGGTGAEEGYGIAVDSQGAVYVVGETTSDQSSFPIGSVQAALPGPDQTHNGGADGFIVKLAPTGTAIEYAGYIGGSGSDTALGVAVDSQGAAFVTGATTSVQTSFPNGNGLGALPGADKTHNGGRDVFVVKVAPGGTGLTYATYIGGAGDDFGQGIAIDPQGAAYVTGYTESAESSFPTGSGFGSVPGVDTTFNEGIFDAFLVKITPSGETLAYASYIGGASFDIAYSVAVDEVGAAYVVGMTASDQASFPDGDGIPIVGPDVGFNGNTDAFIVKVNSHGTAFSYAGYIGGGADDIARSVVIDGVGTAYIAGTTFSTEATFPATGPDNQHNGGSDAFVAVVNPGGGTLAYATYIGGSGTDEGRGIAVDAAGSVYLTGLTTSSQATFPTGTGIGFLQSPDATYNGGGDAFVAKIGMPFTAKPAIYRTGGVWFLRNALSNGDADTVFLYGGAPGEIPLMCDWDGNGSKTPGVVRNGVWFLRNSNTPGMADVVVPYGAAGDTPVCGDWDGNGTQTVGVVRDDVWFLRNANTGGPADFFFRYGLASDKPLVGDWNGNLVDTPGRWRAAVWFLKNSVGAGDADLYYHYGEITDTPIVGDWDGVVGDTAGIVRFTSVATWYLRLSHTPGAADIVFAYGAPGDIPLVWR